MLFALILNLAVEYIEVIGRTTLFVYEFLAVGKRVILITVMMRMIRIKLSKRCIATENKEAYCH